MVRQNLMAIGIFSSLIVCSASGKVAAQDPDLATLLEQSGLAFSQPDKNQPSFRVTYEMGGTAEVVVVNEVPLEGKFADGTQAKFITMFSYFTPAYTQDVLVPPAMLRKMSEMNASFWGGCLYLYTDPQTGAWNLGSKNHMFLRGATMETLRDNIYMTAGMASMGRAELLPMISAQATSATGQ